MAIDNSLKLLAIGEFIRTERVKAISFLMKNYSLREEDAKDVVQESCLALFLNIKKGRLVKLTSTLSTYFTQICINQALNFLKKKQGTVPFSQAIEVTREGEYDMNKVDILLAAGGASITPEQKQLMYNLIQNLPKPCDDILWYYYWDNLNMKAIAELLDYRNSDTAKSKKSQCMGKLKVEFIRKKEEFYGE